MKQGYPLREISAFDTRTLNTLRDRLSVTTAEEFLHTAKAFPDEMSRLLAIDPRGVTALSRAVATVLGHEASEAILNPPAVDYPFRTGHDAPAGTGTTL
ncbi:hypothetical protein [Longimicrobium sp.]|uniref:hypothetical protein n=1 Tax=Longimicrobium sp. TaxID=2029185 RepID=UPI002CEA1357|nr:hypothetical protein [Longimicrobium sp.]HSU15625.1 hypothetical protein [Longimicrobium sp.]